MVAVLAVSWLALSSFGGLLFDGYRGERKVNDVPLLWVGASLSDRDLETIAPAFTAGFDALEPDGIWMNAAEAQFSFLRPPVEQKLQLELGLVPLVGGSRATAEIFIESDGVWHQYLLVEGMNKVQLNVSREEVQLFNLACKALLSPSMIGANSDTRLLCVKVVSVALEVFDDPNREGS